MDELERLQELVARAKAGDQTAMPELRKLMEQRTDICQALGDAHNESLACWIKRLSKKVYGTEGGNSWDLESGSTENPQHPTNCGRNQRRRSGNSC
ncbi:MAG: hypothetical protein VB878_19040, partial [Pirellulaceae bacterium]